MIYKVELYRDTGECIAMMCFRRHGTPDIWEAYPGQPIIDEQGEPVFAFCIAENDDAIALKPRWPEDSMP